MQISLRFEIEKAALLLFDTFVFDILQAHWQGQCLAIAAWGYYTLLHILLLSSELGQ
ncbi:MAG: hypothetical protein HC800_10320 [Phormidesmis sp. RL_2_1]|nr:hypothetical protein [Phormidesmis sp. RL_2_1]